ncbi:hypothetical protein MP228_002278 [Amoeboaphelidium protococcarum]|nr:hypothetical protein MP228_002278 [Amoeboaphelidium protococcarum]
MLDSHHMEIHLVDRGRCGVSVETRNCSYRPQKRIDEGFYYKESGVSGSDKVLGQPEVTKACYHILKNEDSRQCMSMDSAFGSDGVCRVCIGWQQSFEKTSVESENLRRRYQATQEELDHREEVIKDLLCEK